MSKENFAIAIFGNNNQPKELVEIYFKDWENSGYSIDLYKMLLKTRG